MVTFREMLRHLRISNNMSQADLAEKLGVAKSTISMYEVGKREPDLDTLEQIANIFDVDMNYLLGREAKDGPVYYLSDEARDMAEFMFRNPEYKVLFDASRKVKKEDIRFVKKMLDRVRGDADDTGC